MHILKGETKNFPDYLVEEVIELPAIESLWQQLWRLLTRTAQPKETIVRELKNVIEADDTTGLLTYQLTDDSGQLIFSNGQDDIVLDNGVKTMLLVPPFRHSFHSAGFRPKLATHYVERIRITYRGPVQQTVIRVDNQALQEAAEVTT